MNFELIVKDKTTEKIKALIEETAKRLLLAKEHKRKILLRYHSDADGISGALALTSFLNCRSEKQKSAVYCENDAIHDLAILVNENKPIMILVDFGSGQESIAALKMLKGIELFVIDHHPPTDEIENTVSFFLSPWRISNDPDCSKYTAGYLCSEIARFAGVDATMYAKISCAGDKSDILQLKKEDHDRALVLDYIATHDYKDLDYCRKMLTDEDLFFFTLCEATEKIENISTQLLKGIRSKTIGKLSVYLLNMEKPLKDFKSRGKIVTHIYEKLENEYKEKAILLIGYGKRSVMLRVNSKAFDLGINAKKIVENLKISMKNFVENAGGHEKAAAARLREGFARSAADEIIKMLEKESEY